MMDTHNSESAEAIRANREERRLDAAETALDQLGVAREAYERFQEAWGEVGRLARGLNEMTWHRVDAYPGWSGTRDVGAGTDME